MFMELETIILLDRYLILMFASKSNTSFPIHFPFQIWEFY